MMTTLGCLNWAMVTASCRNFTLSLDEDPSLRVFMATGTFPDSASHVPWSTLPNWPEPRCRTKLCQRILLITKDPSWILGYWLEGRFQKKIKGSSFVGVAATPLKPLPIASCYRVKQRGTSYRVLDMYIWNLLSNSLTIWSCFKS